MVWFFFNFNGVKNSMNENMYKINTKKVDTYKSLTYEEDERKNNPIAFWNNGKGNRKNQTVVVREQSQIEKILSKLNLHRISTNCLDISILWNFPRKQYKESKMWVCMTVYYSTRYYCHYAVSDNIVTQDDQKKAMEIIDFLNESTGVETYYPDDKIGTI